MLHHETHARIAPLDRARSFVTLLVLLHHAALNYIYFGEGDPKRWLGFDLIVLFNDSFFMAFMFLISGLFVYGECSRKGPVTYLRDHAWRLGIPYLVSIAVLMPIAYYPTFLRYHVRGTTDFNFLHYWWRTVTVGPWPSGPSWFLWVLLAFDAGIAALFRFAPDAIRGAGRWLAERRNSAMTLFAGFSALNILVYVPLAVIVGDSTWLAFGPLPIQTSRILLYATSFLAGVAVGATDLRNGVLSADGALARRWHRWWIFAALWYAAMLALVYVKHNFIASGANPPMLWSVTYSLAFALFSAAMAFSIPALMLRFANRPWPLLDRMQPSAYGIFLVHYVFILWLQYALYDIDLPAIAKFAVVFAGTLSLSWLVTLALRQIPAVARMI